MKTYLNLAYTFIFTIIISNTCFSQTFEKLEITDNISWHEESISGNIDLVNFFTTIDLHNGTQVLLVKIINSNDFDIKVSYQSAAESPISNVIIPSKSQVTGDYKSIDPNVTKLVFYKPKENSVMLEYIKQHTSVTKHK